MKRNENGHRVYINVWPKWLDIDAMIYRPLLLKVFPFIGAFVARTAGSLVDWGILCFKKILFFKRPERFVAPENNHFGTYETPAKEKPLTKGMGFTLLLFGAGVIFVLAYLIVWGAIVTASKGG